MTTRDDTNAALDRERAEAALYFAELIEARARIITLVEEQADDRSTIDDLRATVASLTAQISVLRDVT